MLKIYLIEINPEMTHIFIGLFNIIIILKYNLKVIKYYFLYYK